MFESLKSQSDVYSLLYIVPNISAKIINYSQYESGKGFFIFELCSQNECKDMEIKKTDYQLRIINILKELRQNQNMTQALVSDLLGINSYGQIGNIESPKFPHKYTLKQISVLCREFNYPIESVFLNEEELKLDKNELVKCLIEKLVEYDG